AMMYNFKLEVNGSGQSCGGDWDFVDPALMPNNSTFDIADLTQGFRYGDVFDEPSNPADFDQVFTVTNNLDSGSGSLRDAISQSETYSLANPTKSILINFDINLPLPIQIQSNSNYETHARNIVLDATTQPGFDPLNGPAIKVNGSGFLFSYHA